jgi:hypothetical protein
LKLEIDVMMLPCNITTKNAKFSASAIMQTLKFSSHGQNEDGAISNKRGFLFRKIHRYTMVKPCAKHITMFFSNKWTWLERYSTIKTDFVIQSGIPQFDPVISVDIFTFA